MDSAGCLAPMCGIAGIFDSDLSEDRLQQALSAMEQAMVHRGPDDGSIRLMPEVRGGLAARRLSLVDLEHGSQPIPNEDKTVWAMLNGEIYNHTELREELRGQGHQFRTACDTEVSAHLYERDGEEFLTRLHGMFALAVLDLPNGRLLLARDGPGMKPLYYARTSNGFLFASEAKALLASGLVEARPDVDALDVFLAKGFVPPPMTAFAGISKLAAGERLMIDRTGVRRSYFSRYVYEDDATMPTTDEGVVDEFGGRLEASVQSHLRADVDVGALLSGGWDSSLTSLFASRVLGSKLKTFSIIFPEDPDRDESRFSRLMAERLGSDHHEIEYRRADFEKLAPGIAHALDEPQGAATAAPAERIFHLASRHVKTVLGGEGADELFGGYDWYRKQRPYWVRAVAPRLLLKLAAQVLPEGRYRAGFRQASADSLAAVDAEWMRSFTVEQKRCLLKREYWSADPPDLSPTLLPDDAMTSCRDSVDRRLGEDVHGRLPSAILQQIDRLSMTHSLEVRSPFLDRGVVDFARKLPSRFKIRDGREKYVVRKLAERLLPPEIAARRKQGLAYPKNAFSTPPTDRYVRELLLESASSPFERSAVEREMPQLFRHERGASLKLYRLTMLQAWWNVYLA